MKYQSWMLIAVFAVWCGLVSGAEETHTFKLKTSAKGDISRVNREISSDTILLVKVDGKTILDKKEAFKEIYKYREEILEKEEKSNPNKVRRVYETAQMTRDDKTSDFPFHEKTILIEKKDSNYTFRVEKGSVMKQEEIPTLVKEFAKEGSQHGHLMEMFPKKPVIVNDTWKLEPAVVERFIGGPNSTMKLNQAKLTATGKLVKAYKKDGKQFGELEFSIEAPLVAIQKVEFAEGAKYSIKINLDLCIDGSIEQGTVKSTTRLVGEGKEGKTDHTMDIKTTVTQSREPTK